MADVAARTGAAVFGGYVLAAAFALALTGILPLSAPEAAITGALPSFAVHTAAVLWAFATGDAMRAWAGLLLPAALCGAIAWLGA